MFNETDWELVRAHLATIQWEVILPENSSVEEKWLAFKNVIKSLTSMYVPIKQISKNSAPWFNPHLKRMKNKKKRKWSKYKHSNANRHLREFKNYAKLYQKEIEATKARYEEKKFFNRKYQPKQFFNFIKNVNNDKSGVAPLENCGILVENEERKAEILSQHYKTVYVIDNSLQPVCDQKMPENSFSHIDITEINIVDAITDMNADSSPGIDRVYPKPLLNIFKSTIRDGVLPEDWVTSIITPVYKKNSKPNKAVSYRPINLTCCTSKIFERVLHTKILTYLKENDLISTVQHGFLSKRSTITNLLTCTFDWVEYFNQKRSVDIIYIDYEKAFDKISHPKLIYRLKKLGIGGCAINWLESFITTRRQGVRVNGAFSNFEPVSSGVAQGTLAGPLLFILYISDISTAIEYRYMRMIQKSEELAILAPNATN